MNNLNPPKHTPSADHPFRKSDKTKKQKRAEYPSLQPKVRAEYQARYMERLKNGSKDRIQEALEQEARTRRNIEAMEDQNEQKT